MPAQTIPILPSSDFDQTASFYARLGFTESGRWPREYLILKGPESIELHFWFNPEVQPLKNDVACYVRFGSAADAQALNDRWAAIGLDKYNLRAPGKTDYGLLEFALIDCHGNLLRIGG